MSDARAEILARIGRAEPARRGTVAQRGPDSAGNPTRGRWEERAARFSARARAAAATVATVPAVEQVADAIADYLASQGLAPMVHLSGSPPGLQLLPPEQRLRPVSSPLRDDGDVVVTGCLAALADEGAVALASGPTHALESAFLAATHVVVVTADQLVDSLDSLWHQLRVMDQPLPRMINLILGPSRTADLGVPSRLGAHGPLRVHVVLVSG